MGSLDGESCEIHGTILYCHLDSEKHCNKKINIYIFPKLYYRYHQKVKAPGARSLFSAKQHSPTELSTLTAVKFIWLTVFTSLSGSWVIILHLN